MNRLTITVLLIFTMFSHGYSQSYSDEVKAINNLCFEVKYQLSKDDYTAFYYDLNGRIRKFVKYSDYPDSTTAHIAYYNAEGQLVCIIFNDQQPEGYSYNGTAYAEIGDLESKIIKIDYKVYFVWGINNTITHTQGEVPEFPEKIGNWPLSHYCHTDTLNIYQKVEEQIKTFKSKKVCFTTSKENDKTFINTNSTSIRRNASFESDVITSLDAGAIIEIIDVLHEDMLSDIGTYRWYIIQVNYAVGYVFGAFLEPVEKNID